METKKVNNSPKTLEQLKKEKGETYWARLIAEERNTGEKGVKSNKKPT